MKKILTFTKRELRSHFDHPGGYVVLVVFLGLTLFLFLRQTLILREASLRPLFGLLPWVLLFLVPAITMRSLAADEKEGTSEVLLSQPVTVFQYLVGKYLGALAAVYISVLATLPVVFVLSRFGSFDWGLVFAQYLGTLFLVAAMCAIGFFASGLTKNQVVAFILGIAITFVFIVSGWEAAVGSVSRTFALVLQNLSILWHFSNVTRGVLDARDALYFATLTVLFFSFAYAGFVKSRLTRFGPSWRRVTSWVGAIFVLAVVWNVAMQYLPVRLDLTSGRLYTLSAATKRMVRELKEDITITFYVSQNLPTELAIAQRDVTDMLSDYRTASKGKLAVEVKHPESDEQKRETANAGIPPIQFNVVRKGEFQVKEGFFGLSVAQKDKRAEVIPYVSQTADLEYQLSRLIRRVSDEQKKTVVFLRGHNETSETGYNAFRQELQKLFGVEDVTLSGATSYAATALTHADIFVIAGPREELAETEKSYITQYLAGGGKAFFLVDGVELDLRSLSAVPAKSNLAAYVSETLGVQVRPTVVYDLRAQENVQFNTGGPLSFVLPYPFWVRASGASDTPITKDLKSVVYSWGGSLEIVTEKLSGSEATPILKTTAFGGEQKDAFVLQPNREFPVDKSALGERTLGVLVKNIGGGSGRAIVVGSSTMLSDEVVGGKPENIAFGLNTVDWLAENEDLISIRSKTAGPRVLIFPSPETQTVAQYGLTLGIPVLVIMVGAIRLAFRKRKTRRAYA